MKYLAAVLAVLILAGGAFAADSPKAPGLKITKVTGTVNLMKDGLVVMTLKAGDSIPQLVDPSMTFAVVDGSIEVEAGGQTITGNTGSNFTVSSDKGQVNVAAAAGAPVEVKTSAGNSMVITQNSEVKMVASKDKMEVSVVSGSAVMTNAAGGESKTINAGEKAEVTVPAPAPAAAPAKTEAPAPVEEAPVVTETIPQLPTAPSVNPTQEVAESNEVSPSNP